MQISTHQSLVLTVNALLCTCYSGVFLSSAIKGVAEIAGSGISGHVSFVSRRRNRVEVIVELTGLNGRLTSHTLLFFCCGVISRIFDQLSDSQLITAMSHNIMYTV